LRIAMIGQKGIPARYGGIERHVEEISVRLAARGHEVLVYCRPYYTLTDGGYKGVTLVKLPSIKTRHLDAATHSLLSTAHVLSMKADVVHYHALGPSGLSFLPRMAGARTVATVHGLDWRGGKWGPVAKWVLQRCEYMACHFPSETVVVSNILRQYFRDKYGCSVTYIPNGVTILPPAQPDGLDAYGVTPGEYFLFVGRLGPEKGCHILVEAFTRSGTSRKLLMVGSGHLNPAYEAKLKEAADERVIFAGEIYGDMLCRIWDAAYAVVHPSVTEGMSLALLEAMAHRRCVIVSDIPENSEVVADAGIRFRSGDAEDLRRAIDAVDADASLVEREGEKAVTRVDEAYNWDRIVEALERAYGGK
jgi:glycosyltransferase involved in cell wall biosynthesis